MTSSIQIEGIFGTEVLGSFNIIRGFATLQELARISVPVLMEEPQPDGEVRGHQRPIDPIHAEEVKRYFEQGDQRFIPEIILSVRLPMEAETLPATGTYAPTQVGVRYEGGGIQLKRKHKGKTLLNHILRVKVNALEQIRAEQRIRRIDGNHRLAKAEELPPVSGQVNRYRVPFCLLLLGDVGEPSADYTEALVFHTINSTAKPLDGEFALKLILGQNQLLAQPPHVEFAYAPALHLTRLLDTGLRGLTEPNRTRLGGRSLARLSVASRELLTSYPAKTESLEVLTQFSNDILAALSDVCTHLHGEFRDFCAADYFIELAAHVWIKTMPEEELNPLHPLADGDAMAAGFKKQSLISYQLTKHPHVCPLDRRGDLSPIGVPHRTAWNQRRRHSRLGQSFSFRDFRSDSRNPSRPASSLLSQEKVVLRKEPRVLS